MKLASTEKLLKSYTCGSCKLVVTNRRIVSSRETAEGVRAHEIHIEDVRSLSYGVEVKRHTVWLVLMIVSLVIAAALALILNKYIACIIVAVALAIFAVVCIVLYRTKRDLSFFLTFNVTDSYNAAMKLFEFNSKLTLTDEGISTIRVSVNDAVARQIVDEIGAIIIDGQALNQVKNS